MLSPRLKLFQVFALSSSPSRIRLRFFATAFSLLVLSTAAASSSLLTGCDSPQFPDLASGAYVGEISGLVKDSDQSFSFYVERLGTNATLLMVIFAEGWNPLVVGEGKQLDGTTKTAAPKSGPLKISNGDATYSLVGSKSGDEYSGELTASDETKGKWSLRPLIASELKPKLNQKLAGFSLKDWLQSKVRYNMTRSDFDSLKVSYEQELGRMEKLQRFVKDENVLKDRSRSRKEALATELNRITEARKKSTQEMKDGLADLALLGRSTKEGQAVELNRKIARRENKWFSINWSSEGGAGGNIEEQLAEQENVDLKKLNSAVKHAQEIEQLSKSLEDERLRVHQLETMLQERVRTIERPPTREYPEDLPPANQNDRRNGEQPWWKGWDSATG